MTARTKSSPKPINRLSPLLFTEDLYLLANASAQVSEVAVRLSSAAVDRTAVFFRTV